ncbi:hypothetical protein VNO78_15674 [Psophocarpus tetragonolobus]|uniref:Uncharacterized protein n=1 Tax=Psophocarpus tetragonolobus TaxID=3891 RepID=A0AAN9SF02_PSOTE
MHRLIKLRMFWYLLLWVWNSTEHTVVVVAVGVNDDDGEPVIEANTVIGGVVKHHPRRSGLALPLFSFVECLQEEK